MKKVALITLGKMLEDTICEPLQLGYLAAYLKQRGIEVKIIDEPAGDNLERELANYAPDFVGVTATTPVVSDAYRLLTYCRQKGYTTIIGGVHASTLPEEAKQYADYVVVGEGEVALYTIVSANPPHGIIQGTPIEDLDAIPFPDRSLMNMESYIRTNMKGFLSYCYCFSQQNHRMAAMITSRGCPFKCIYCHNNWRGLPARYYSADLVFNEMLDLKNKYAIDMIAFKDDDLFINKQRMMELSNKLEQANLDIIWIANARVSSVDEEVLEAAYRGGCRHIFYGVESGSQRTLDTLKKHTTVSQAEIAIRLTKQAGIDVFNSFMLGVPGETLEDIKKTKDYIFSNMRYIDLLSFSIATPYPGTAMWEHAKKHNLIPESFNWESFRFASQGGISANEFFTRKQLVKMRFWILIEILLRFNIRFCFYFMKYPLYTFSRFIEALGALLGFQRTWQSLNISHYRNTKER